MAQQWFKFYGSEYLSDPKMLALSPLERSCWLTLLCLASASTPSGVIRHLTEEQLITLAGGSALSNETGSVIKKFHQLTMITISPNGSITIKNWSKRQKMAQTGYERVKRYRARHEKRNDDNADDNSRIEKNRIEKNRMYTLFDEFWDLYPRKTAKQAAIRAWAKIQDPVAVMPQIRASIEASKKSAQWKDNDGRYIPHPATWLNGRRWEDEMQVEISKKPNSLKLK